MRRAALALAAVLWLLPGCAAVRPTLRPLPVGDPRPEALLASLRDTARERHSLRAEVRLHLDRPGGGGHMRQALALARPARMRVEVQDPVFRQTLALLVVDGTTYHYFRADDRFLETGRVYRHLIRDVAGIDLSPTEIVSLMLGTPPLWRGLSRAEAHASSDGDVRVDLVDPAGNLRQRFQSGSDGQLRHAWVFGGGGTVLWQAHFDDYRALPEGESFAHSIEVEFPAAEARASLHFGRVELNPQLPPGVFDFRAPGSG